MGGLVGGRKRTNHAAEAAHTSDVAASCRILRDRLEDDLRHRRGLSYAVEADHVPLGGDRQLAVLVADCRDGDAAVVVRALWRALADLAHDGPTPAELELEISRTQEQLRDPRAACAEAQAAAVSLVTGTVHRTAADLLAQVGCLTVAQVQQAACLIRDAALIAVPEDVDPGLPALTPVRPRSAVMLTGREFQARSRSPAPRGARLVVGKDGLSLWLHKGERLTVRYEDFLGFLDVGDGQWTVASSDGTTVPPAAAD